MKVADVVYDSVVDGDGLRTVIFFSGCSIHCPGCHNKHLQDGTVGKNESPQSLLKRITAKGRFNKNLTLSGGEPLEQDREQLLQFIKLFKHECKEHHKRPNIWLYSGRRYTIAEIREDEGLRKVLKEVDCLVDSPFIKEKKSQEVLYRGSSNQRIIDTKKTLKSDSITHWHQG